MSVLSSCVSAYIKFALPDHTTEIEIQPEQNLAQCPNDQCVTACSNQRVKLQSKGSTCDGSVSCHCTG